MQDDDLIFAPHVRAHVIATNGDASLTSLQEVKSEADSITFETGAGFTLNIADDIALYAHTEAEFGKNLESYNGLVGFRYNFDLGI